MSEDDYYNCLRCGYQYTWDESRAAFNHPMNILRSVGGGIVGPVNFVLGGGKWIRMRKAKHQESCPQCHMAHATCPNCEDRQAFGVGQSYTELTCDNCGVRYGVV